MLGCHKHLAPHGEVGKGGWSHPANTGDTGAQPGPPGRQPAATGTRQSRPAEVGGEDGMARGHGRASSRPRRPGCVPQPQAQAEPYLEEGGILLAVVVLLAGVLPGDAEDALLIVLPHQPWVLATVYLVDQPLAEFPIATAHRIHPALSRLQVHATRVRGRVWGGLGVPHLSAHTQAPALWGAVEEGERGGMGGERKTHTGQAPAPVPV